MVTITKQEYERLLEREQLLLALEACGITDTEAYKLAIQIVNLNKKTGNKLNPFVLT